MYKRPLPKLKTNGTLPLTTIPSPFLKILEFSPTVETKNTNIGTKLFIPKPEPEPRKFPEHVSKLFENAQHRPLIKDMIDAMILDGYSNEKISKVKKFYAWLRNTEEERQNQLDNIFRKYSIKTAPPKKILKVVKKKT
jgi:hypothetical protein